MLDMNNAAATRTSQEDRFAGAALTQAVPRERGTVSAAVSSADLLNSRLMEIAKRLEQAGDALSGPEPEAQAGDARNHPPGGALGVLADHLDVAHAVLGRIERAAARIERSLGA